MTVLIVYGTSEGQTRKIAEWTAKHVRSRGRQVELHAGVQRGRLAAEQLDVVAFDRTDGGLGCQIHGTVVVVR